MTLVSHPALVLLAGISLLCLLRNFYRDLRANPRGLPKPPGPKGYPIIGSILKFPRSKAWLQYDKWLKEYGDLVYLEILGQPLLLLGSRRRAHDIFEKRFKNYSDRPRMPMLDLMEMTYNLALFPYGPWWKRHRRTFHQFFNSNAVPRYRDLQLQETRAFLRRLLASPDDFLIHCHHLFPSLITKITYGITVQEKNDPYIHAIEEAMAGGADAATPGRYLVDVFPFMKHIPSWFPGAGWKKKAEYCRDVNMAVKTKPFEHVKDALKIGKAVPSIATTLIESLPEEDSPKREEEEDIARNVTAVAYLGGAETTLGTVQSFFLAMCLYPEVQKRAQQELDTVLKGRLPDFSDQPSLHYIEAVVKECKRWHLVTPLGVPHTAIDNDEYDGYFIPKGTIVMGCSWTILHDPEVYDEPMEFKPERFLTKDGKVSREVPDPEVASFGFGRRICPGRHLSNNTLFIVIASVLTVFNIAPPLDKDGNITSLQYDCTGELVSFPLPFQARIVPRSKQMMELVAHAD